MAGLAFKLNPLFFIFIEAIYDLLLLTLRDAYMSYLVKITAACLLTSISITSYAQILETAINTEVANNVKFLNLESKKYFVSDADYPDNEPMIFSSNGQKTIMQDVNSDGVKDAVMIFYYCEETNCHATTKSTDLVVFKGLGKGQFTKLGSAPLGLDAKIRHIKNGVINITSYEYGEFDPGCCPSEETSISYKIQKNKLVEINQMKRILK